MRITIIGGGSYQWVPKLLVDFANTHLLHDAEIVIEDIDPAPISDMVDLVHHIAKVRSIGLTATGTTDQRAALEGADYVVVNISTGGFASMRQDLEVPARYGIMQSVGDSVGPGGIMRALRNIPVFLGLARDMEELCPDAWMLNLTNPMTTICRAVTRESSVRTVGLCHEIIGTSFLLSILLGVDFRELDPIVAGVNHLPLVTHLDAAGDDGLALLRELLDDDGRPAPGVDATKAGLLDHNRLKLHLFARFGVLPGAGDRHVAEFFPGFLTEQSGWGERWNVHLTTIEHRETDQARHVRELERILAADSFSTTPSGEMVAPVIRCLELDRTGVFPLNTPNEGQVTDLPDGIVVESMCEVDGKGIRGRDQAALPPPMAECLRRVCSAQERTVEAAVSGDRDTVVEAMFLDPLAGRIDADRLAEMTDEMLAATEQWLPQFVV